MKKEDKYTQLYMRQYPGQKQAWIRQNRLFNGGLIGLGLVMIQPFLAADSIDMSATICVISFAVAIPLLAAMITVNEQESFRHQLSNSKTLAVAKTVAMASVIVGLVAGFWHITWVAGLAVIISAFFGLAAHSAGYTRLDESFIKKLSKGLEKK